MVLKNSLYENLVSQVITKDEYKDLKKNYDKNLDEIAQKQEDLERKYRVESLRGDENPQWIEEFLLFQSTTTLTRRAVVQLLQSIIIGEGIQLNFRYQDEFNDILELLSGYEEVG